METEFTYQLFWLRVLALVPLIFILAIVEYQILIRLGLNLEKYPIIFYFSSAIIMIILAHLFFKFTYRLFKKNGIVCMKEDVLIIKMGKNNLIIKYDNIIEVKYTLLNIYNVSIGMLIFSYYDNDTVVEKKIYSEDITRHEISSSSLVDLFNILNNYSKHNMTENN